MPNAKDLERQLREFQNLLPQIVGSLLAIITAIGVIIGAIAPELGGGSHSNGRGGDTATGQITKPSKSDLADYRAINDGGIDYISARNFQADLGVTVNGKDYDRSFLSSEAGLGGSYHAFDIPKSAGTLSFKAAWADTVPNEGGLGTIEVKLNGAPRKTIKVAQGKTVDVQIDVRGGGRLKIALSAVDSKDGSTRVNSSGLALLSPKVK